MSGRERINGSLRLRPASSNHKRSRASDDHVGAEVKNLEAFCRSLEANGIALTTPYRKAPGMNNIGTAFIIDPWGVSIELTEGLSGL